jgi:tetratricopeptide (TPR) repeat protein
MTKIKGIIAMTMLMSFIGVPYMADEGGSASSNPSSSTELLKKADSLFNAKEYEKSREAYIKVSEMAEESDEKSNLVEAFAMIGRTYLKVNQKEPGYHWLSKARDFASVDQPLGWSRYLGVCGRFEWRNKELEKATETFVEMYNYCSDRKLHDRAVDAARMIGITGTSEQQIEWGMKGIAEAGNMTGILGPLWNNLGWTYEDIGKYPEAVNAYTKAREYHWKYGDERNKLIADWAVGHAYRLNGEFDKAEVWLRPLPDWCRKIDETEFLGFSLKELGYLSLGREDTTEALNYFVEAEKNLKAVGMPEWDAEGYKQLLKEIEELKNKGE